MSLFLFHLKRYDRLLFIFDSNQSTKIYTVWWSSHVSTIADRNILTVIIYIILLFSNNHIVCQICVYYILLCIFVGRPYSYRISQYQLKLENSLHETSNKSLYFIPGVHARLLSYHFHIIVHHCQDPDLCQCKAFLRFLFILDISKLQIFGLSQTMSFSLVVFPSHILLLYTSGGGKWWLM